MRLASRLSVRIDESFSGLWIGWKGTRGLPSENPSGALIRIIKTGTGDVL
jgi:hypothetical protein